MMDRKEHGDARHELARASHFRASHLTIKGLDLILKMKPLINKGLNEKVKDGDRGTRRELFNDECNEERMKLSIKKQRGRGPLLGIPKGEKPRDGVLALRVLAFPPFLHSFLDPRPSINKAIFFKSSL